jgi:class I fructose-bisphosphate aldolase
MMDLSRISKNNKFFFLAYDHGMEHGPKDFNIQTANPKTIFNLAKSNLFTGIIVQKGIAEKYYSSDLKTPLIIKLNGKTNFMEEDPYSPQVCSVEEAIRLRAKAVGYTIYVGSRYESKMFKEFGNIVYEAHDVGIPVIAWMYPRGHWVEENTESIAYGARVGLELGADIVKVKYTGSTESMNWVVSCAGNMPVCIAGGEHHNIDKLKEEVSEAMKAGCMGAAVGRNVWQDDDPLNSAKELANIIFT